MVLITAIMGYTDMFHLDVDSGVDVAERFSGNQYPAPMDHIVMDDSVGLGSSVPYFDKPLKQKRKCCRYVRNDIKACVSENRFLFRRELREVRLIDVSQVGCAIGYRKKLKYGQHLRLMLMFQGGPSFEFDCSIANRRVGDPDMIYGLYFNNPNHLFEEHLLKTGLKIKMNKLSIMQ